MHCATVFVTLIADTLEKHGPGGPGGSPAARPQDQEPFLTPACFAAERPSRAGI